ncbi:hypothetical protein [Prochlorococcus marinus]|uniref:Uncharacterized protein n=1 Tax=Prochlorococcus marinus (strain AS9601) TaxID=146891 RepID=A2BSC7_PROMS|nr:hypothetical protein [Prochlorococcus marinus]ABM70688.1 Hypothetical protein A9601_14041 [Prochlorococcus marinus str. AS9601]
MKISKSYILCLSLFLPFRSYIILFPLIVFSLFNKITIPRKVLRDFLVCIFALSIALIFGNSINFEFNSSSNLLRIFREYFSTVRYFFLIVIFCNAVKNIHRYHKLINKLEKFFTGFLVLNSLVILLCLFFPQLNDFLKYLYNFGNVVDTLPVKYRAMGLVGAYEYSSLACISLSILGLVNKSQTMFYLGIFSSAATGRFGVLASFLLIFFQFASLIFVTLKKLIFNLKISKNISVKILISVVSLSGFLLTIYLLLVNILGQNLSISQLVQIFGDASYFSNTTSSNIGVFDKLGYANYDIFADYFKSRMGFTELMIGSGDSSIDLIEIDSGWYRLLNKGGILFLIFTLSTFFYFLKKSFERAEKIIENKDLYKKLKFYISTYSIFMLLLNTKSMALLSSFTLDIFLITILIIVNCGYKYREDYIFEEN